MLSTGVTRNMETPNGVPIDKLHKEFWLGLRQRLNQLAGLISVPGSPASALACVTNFEPLSRPDKEGDTSRDPTHPAAQYLARDPLIQN